MTKHVVWFVPDLIQGSGGHRTILTHAHHMKVSGWTVTLLLEAVTERRGESPQALVKRIFGLAFEDVRVGWGDAPSADAYFATIWYSAKLVRDLPASAGKYYFVQDYEALFLPVSSTYLAVENTYRYGLGMITIGNWLAHELNSKFAARVLPFEFTADLGTYRDLGATRDKDTRDKDAVCFVYQPEKSRRCAEIGLRALALVKHHRPKTRIRLFGSERRAVGTGFEHLGLLDLAGCNRLYNECALGLCISATNPSRVPFEMLAAGLPVVDVWRENNLYDMPDSSVCLATQNPESIAKAIIALLDDPARLLAMSVAGLAHMATRDTAHGLSQFMDAIEALSTATTVSGSISRRYWKPAVTDEELSLNTPAVPDEIGPSWQTRMRRWLPPFAARWLIAVKQRLTD